MKDSLLKIAHPTSFLLLCRKRALWKIVFIVFLLNHFLHLLYICFTIAKVRVIVKVWNELQQIFLNTEDYLGGPSCDNIKRWDMSWEGCPNKFILSSLGRREDEATVKIIWRPCVGETMCCYLGYREPRQ